MARLSITHKARRFARLAGLFSIITLIVVQLTAPAQAASTRHGNVVILVIDQITLADLKGLHLPNIQSLIDRGAIGAMNVRVANTEALSPGYLSLGTGNKADGISRKPGPVLPAEGLEPGERLDGRSAGDVYYERTGRKLQSPAAANLSINAIVLANQQGDMGAVPGSLGGTLREAGLKTAAIGNLDTRSDYGRGVIDIVMDEKGKVDYGVLNTGLVRADRRFPTGRRTDRVELAAAFYEAYMKTDVIAVDWGDTSRVWKDAPFLTAENQRRLINASLRRADVFVGDILRTIDLDRDLLIIVVPDVSPPAAENNNLITPTIAAGKGINRGLLTTPTTRRDGIVTNTDIAPTVLDFFGLSTPTDMIGRPLSVAPFAGDRLDFLIKSNQDWINIRNLQAPPLRAFAFWAIGIMLASMVLLLFPAKRFKPAWLRPFLLSLLAIPLAMLLLSLIGQSDLLGIFTGLIGITAVVVALASWRARLSVDAIGYVSLLVWGIVLADLALNGPLLMTSIFSYSVIEGARYYGIGNEFLGVLVGAATIGSFYLLNRFSPTNAPRVWPKALVVTALVASAFLVSSAAFGAKFGGMLTIVAGFSIGALGLIKGRIRVKDLGIVAIFGSLFIVMIVAYDLIRGGSGSHVGLLVGAIKEQGVAPLINVVGRKVAMNMKLVEYALWNWVNVVSVVVLVVAFYGLRKRLRWLFKEYEYFKPILSGGLVAAVTAFVVNDSGVVAMAQIFIYLVPATLYLMTYQTAENR